MFGKNKEASFGTEVKTKISTIIGEGAVFDGNLSAPDSMRIDGTINGNCRCENELIIGASGAVEGNIFAKNIMISGKVNGDISANGKLELLSTGKISGNISAKSLVIDENASFDGRCTMTTTASQDTSSAQSNTRTSSDNASRNGSSSHDSSSEGSSSDNTSSSGDDSKEDKSTPAVGPPSRNFVRISAPTPENSAAADSGKSTDAAGSSTAEDVQVKASEEAAANTVGTESQHTPAPARRGRPKTAASQNSSQ